MYNRLIRQYKQMIIRGYSQELECHLEYQIKDVLSEIRRYTQEIEKYIAAHGDDQANINDDEIEAEGNTPQKEQDVAEDVIVSSNNDLGVLSGNPQTVIAEDDSTVHSQNTSEDSTETSVSDVNEEAVENYVPRRITLSRGYYSSEDKEHIVNTTNY